jgi:HlyD family secretion protein
MTARPEISMHPAKTAPFLAPTAVPDLAPVRRAPLCLTFRRAVLVSLGFAALGSSAVHASALGDSQKGTEGQKSADTQKNADGQKSAMSVSVTTPQTAPLVRTLVATGSVFAWQEAVIGPEVGGYRVKAVNVDVGDKVRRGQELVRLSDELLVADANSKRAAKTQAEAQLVTASSDRRRGDSLKDSGALSSSELEKLHNDELAAQAKVQQANADLEAAELKLRYARVLAPDDGVITSRTVVVGQVAQAGSEMLRLLRNERIEWRAEIPEGRIRDVHVGQNVHVTTADGSQIIGKVRTVSPTVQPGTRTGLVYVDLPKRSDARPGMFARGEIEISKGTAATLPLASVVVRDGYSYVFVVAADQKVARRRVETGSVRDGRVEIVAGLNPGERVVERGAGFLQDGDRVSVTRELAGPT